MKVFQSTAATLLQQAGQSYRQVLEEYKRINILSSFIHEIKPPEEHSHQEVIPLTDIQAKAVYVQLDNSLYDYVLKLKPGAYERREAARRSVKLPYIVCPILCRISRPEFWLKTRLIRKQHVHTYFVKKPAGCHHHSRRALGNP